MRLQPFTPSKPSLPWLLTYTYGMRRTRSALSQSPVAVFGGAVSRVVSEARRARDLPRKALAVDAGQRYEHACKIERGRRALTVSMALVWANILGCEPRALVLAVLQDQVTAAGVTLVVRVDDEGPC